MRSILSFVALACVTCSTVGPAFSQRMIKQPTTPADSPKESKAPVSKGGKTPQKPGLPKPGALPEKIEFGKVEVYSDGKGAWVRWRMITEDKNAGFRVYRLDKAGENPVSEFILGSYYTPATQDAEGAYNYYDPKGTQEMAYLVEAVSLAGKTLRTGYFVPEYVQDIDATTDGARVRSEALAPKAGDNLVSQTLNVSSDLQTEIQSGLYVADPTRHREVIATAGGVKITSKSEGVIRVTKTELQTGGFDVNSNSGNWQLYCEGVEVAMIVAQNADYIEFLARPVNTLETNIRTYYLIPGASAGRRIENRAVRRPLSTVKSRKYSQTFVRSDKKIYVSQVLNGTAENWWGDVTNGSTFDYKFDLSGIDQTAGTRKLTVNFQGLSITPHSVELTLNGTVLPNATGSGVFPFQAVIDVPVTSLINGQNTLRMRSVGLGFSNGVPINGDISLLARLSIDFPRDYLAIGNELKFYTENYKNSTLSGFSSSNVRVFDVTFENNPRLLTGLEVVQTNGTWGPVIPAGRGQVLYAVEAGVLGSALSVTPNDPSILADPSNAGTMVIISHPSLMTQANAWANYRAGQGIVTKVIDVTEIYDEFSYGLLSSHAIEDFLSYAKTNWQTKPSYVLLIGDGSYDSKNYDAQDLGYWNMIPARFVDTLYTETGSDEALSDFNGDGLAEIPIGRVPARDAESVTNHLNKTIAWEQALNANSMNRGVLFAYDWPQGYDFHAMSDRIMAHISNDVPKTSIAQSTFNEATQSWVADPTAQPAIIAAINELDGGTTESPGTNAGQYLLNYTGHGTPTAWRNSSFFSASQAPSLTNAAYPSLMISLTCLNGYFMTTFDSFAEAMTKRANGGAPAVWASTGETTPDVQEIMADRFYSKINEGSVPRLGDLIADAKAQVPAGADVRLSWALIGDPMLKVR